MDKTAIMKISVLEDGRLAIFPEQVSSSFQYIYREAAGVYWDDDLKCFKSTPPSDWNYYKWYQHIVTLVRSAVQLQMLLTPKTVYDSQEAEFIDTIKKADEDLWR